MLREDARVAMPPNPFWLDGREAIVQSLIVGLPRPVTARHCLPV
jgi:hypothetical protein